MISSGHPIVGSYDLRLVVLSVHKRHIQKDVEGVQPVMNSTLVVRLGHRKLNVSWRLRHVVAGTTNAVPEAEEHADDNQPARSDGVNFHAQ